MNNKECHPQSSSVRDILHQFLYAADSLMRTAHLDKAKSTAVNEAYGMITKLSVLYGFLQLYTSNALVSANFLQSNEQIRWIEQVQND